MSFKMNKNIVKLIRLQRTEMKNFSFEEVKNEYYNSCVRDFEFMTSSFPEKVKTILDIGAGIGGIDILIKQQLGIDADLLDRNGISSNLLYGFSEDPAMYSIKQSTESFFKMNGINDVNYYIEYPFQNKYDFIFSCISCGFHYPVRTYLSQIKSTLSKSGRFFLDIRKQRGEMDYLAKAFNKMTILKTGSTAHQVVCEGIK